MSEINSIISQGEVDAYLFSNADGKEWLVPVKNMRTGLELYQPSGAKGITLKHALPWTHRFTVVRRLANMQKQNVQLLPELMEVAEKAFGEKNLEFSIFGGTPSVHCKATIQFFKGTRILGYAKITVSQAVEGLFRHEHNILNRLNEAGVSWIPKCLYCGHLSDERAVFIQSTEKELTSEVIHTWRLAHDAFLHLLHKKTKTEMLFDESDIATSLRQLKELLPVIPFKYRSKIEPILNDEYSARIGKTQVFSAFHADFTPWNMVGVNSRLFVFDWEYAQLSYPPYLDRYHFFVQPAIHVYRKSADEIYAQLSKYEWFDRSELRLYILDIISRFIGREKGSYPSDLDQSMEIWTQLLLK